MALRSFLAELRRAALQSEAKRHLWRPMRSYGRAPIIDDTSRVRTRNELGSKLLRLRYPSGCATTVLQNWTDNGYRVSSHELRKFSVKLLKLKRNNHALQVMEWMETRSTHRMLPSDYSVKMELLVEAKGLMEAEGYFENLSGTVPRKAAGFQLLRGYVKERETEKAEAFMAKMNSLGLIVSPHPYNEMMKLYIAVSQFQKVPLVINEMRRNRIPLNVLSYNLWMNACWESSGIESVETVYQEMMRDGDIEIGWSSLSTLANAYAKAGQAEKTRVVLQCAEKKLSNSHRLGYFFLITQYASLNDKNGVLRLWEASKAVEGRISCSNYMSVMLCLVKMGDLAEAEKVFAEWESDHGRYDIRVSNVLLGAYARSGMMEKAEALHRQALQKGGCPNYKTWEILMEGWARNREMQKAVDAMEKAFSKLKDCHWRPSNSIVMNIAEYFESKGDVESANRYVKTVHDLGFANVALYKSLLRIHHAARKPVSDILKMMEKDGIEMDGEVYALVQSNH